MKRLLSKIGKPEPVKAIKVRDDRTVYLPCYLTAQRREQAIIVVVQAFVIDPSGFGSVRLHGNDRGKKWHWCASYNRAGEKVGNSSEYAGPYSIFPAFVKACFDGLVIGVADHNVESTKHLYDRKFRQRIEDGAMTEGDVIWYEQLGRDLRNL